MLPPYFTPEIVRHFFKDRVRPVYFGAFAGFHSSLRYFYMYQDEHYMLYETFNKIIHESGLLPIRFQKFLKRTFLPDNAFYTEASNRLHYMYEKVHEPIIAKKAIVFLEKS